MNHRQTFEMISSFLGSLKEPFLSQTWDVKIQDPEADDPDEKEIEYSMQDPAGSAGIPIISSLKESLTRLEESIEDFGLRLFHDPTQDYGEDMNWHQLTGYSESFRDAGVFDPVTMKKTKDRNYSLVKGLLYAVLENVTDSVWILRDSAWDELEALFNDTMTEFESFDPGFTHDTGSFVGSILLMTGDPADDQKTGDSSWAIKRGAVDPDDPETLADGNHEFIEPVTIPAIPDPMNPIPSSKSLVMSDFKSFAFWGSGSGSALRAGVKKVKKTLESMADDVDQLIAIIGEYKAVGELASRRLAAASSFNGAESQLGAEDKYSMVGVHMLSGSKYGLWSQSTGYAFDLFKRAREAIPEHPSVDVSKMTTTEMMTEFKAGRLNPNAQLDVSVARADFIASEALRESGLFERGKEMKERIELLARRRKWL